jgi:6-phosphogluconolactonase
MTVSAFRLHCYPDSHAVAKAAVERIVHLAEEACARQGAFRIVLAGGSTPRQTYRLLAKQRLNWPLWHVYYSDERCLPASHPERNSFMAAEAFLDRVSIPVSNIHPIPAESGPAKAAQAYTAHLQYAVPFDMVLLGLGEDGHTASLFPGHTRNPAEIVHPVFDAPKPPPERVSLSAAVLADTRSLFVLVTGDNKRDALQAWETGKDLPISHIRPSCGIDVLADTAAAGGFKSK